MQTTCAPRVTPPFPSNLGLLEEHYQRWCWQQTGEPASDADRAVYNLSLIVPHQAWQTEIDRVVAAILLPRNDRLTVMIEGPSLNGKTTFAIEVLMRVLHAIRLRYGRVWSTDDTDDDLNPVIAVKGSTGKHADYMRSLMNAVDLPSHGTAEDMLLRFGAYCQRHFVLALLVDDIHVTTSREGGVENFYKRVVDLVPCVLFTALDFNQSPLPRPHVAPQSRADTLKQIWGRALPKDDPDADRALTFGPEDPTTQAGRVALAKAIVDAGKALKLNNQAGSDLTDATTITALVARHDARLATILSHIAQAGAAAVGQSERVGSRELGLTIPTSSDKS